MLNFYTYSIFYIQRRDRATEALAYRILQCDIQFTDTAIVCWRMCSTFDEAFFRVAVSERIAGRHASSSHEGLPRSLHWFLYGKVVGDVLNLCQLALMLLLL